MNPPFNKMKNITVYQIIRRMYLQDKLSIDEVKLAREYLFFPGTLLNAPFWQETLKTNAEKCMKIVNLVADIRARRKK